MNKKNIAEDNIVDICFKKCSFKNPSTIIIENLV